MIKFSPKFKDFFTYHKATREFLEGQTYAGKTTIAAPKFITMVMHSKKKQHGIAGLDIGTVEKNIINKDNGLLELFGDEIVYNGNGTAKEGLPHLYINSREYGEKIIYVFGYCDAARWKKALGGQLGCLLIDECNIADIDFIREAAMRCDYLLCTLNPDDPNLPIYSEYINHSRPLAKYIGDYPQELLSQLESQKEYSGWVHWYFTMDDNASATEEKKQQIRDSIPEGSKIWKNKILGLRGRSEGLVYNFNREKQSVKINHPSELKSIWLPNEYVYRVIVGLDSGLNEDATALAPLCVTSAGRLIGLPSMYYEPKLGSNASSQQALIAERWLDYWFGYAEIDQSQAIIVGDSAALTQSVILEINIRTKYSATKVPKKDIQKDTQRAIGIIEKPDYFIQVDCGRIDPQTFEKVGNTDMAIIELENKVWDKKKGNVPEDGNDHWIDAFKYATYLLYYSGA